RKFHTEADEPGRIVARFDHGSESVRVAIEYADRQYTVKYLDSAGYKTMPAAAGGTLIEDRYTKLVAKLEHSIGDEIGRPAREAAEAVERERRQQLDLAREKTAQARARSDAAASRANAAASNAQAEAWRAQAAANGAAAAEAAPAAEPEPAPAPPPPAQTRS